MSMSAAKKFATGYRDIPASFYRGGTSRGLVFRESSLALFSQQDRDKIICQASSPDPDGRQIDGLGGGASSLSKVAIVSRAGNHLANFARLSGKPFPGLEWLDDTEKAQAIADVVYRFGQVSIKEASVDWGSTCGNMVAAVAHFSIMRGVARKPLSLPRAGDVDQNAGQTFYWPIRILAHDTGKVVTAQVPVVSRYSEEKEQSLWLTSQKEDTQIAGVPGRAPGIQIETPLEGSVLPTGNQRDRIEVDGKEIDVSIIDTGLPVVFVSAKSLDIPLSLLLQHPESIDANIEIKAKLEAIRQKACHLTPQLQAVLSPPSPKICVVHPRCDYTTTGGEKITADSMDILIRVVSTGQLHRTVPATTLAALAASRAFENSIVCEEVSGYSCKATQEAIKQATEVGEGTNSEYRAITVGQPAGCSTATLKVENNLPSSIVMMRTARCIIDGKLPVDPSLNYDRSLFVQLEKAKRERHRG